MTETARKSGRHYLATIVARYGSAHAVCSCGLTVDVQGQGFDQDVQVVRALVKAHEREGVGIDA